MTRRHITPEMNGRRLRHAEYWSQCAFCGRSGLERNHKSVATFLFHYAPCGRPCAGGSLAHLSSEDKPNGIHADRQCTFCNVRMKVGS